MAVSLRILVPAAAGLLLTLLLWALLTSVFHVTPQAERWLDPGPANPLRAIDEAVPDQPPLLAPLLAPAAPQAMGDLAAARFEPPSGGDGTRGFLGPVFSPWKRLSGPVWAALHLRATLADLVCLLLCGLVGVGIWAFVGGAISRMAAVELSCEERVGAVSAARYAKNKWVSYFAAPLLPVVGIGLLALPAWVLGWLMRADVGLLIVGIAWPVLLGLGFVMVLLLAGLLFGWPLMWASISTEGTDGFDALSRSYAYVFQRPLHLLFYVVVAAVIGGLGWIVVVNFASGIVWLTYWAASWSSGAERIESILGSGAKLSGAAASGAALVRFFAGCVKLLAIGYVYGYFWVAATAIYLLLRRDVDGTELDEVFLDADEDEEQFELPPLRTDESGAPQVGERPPGPGPSPAEGERPEDGPGDASGQSGA